MNARSFQNKKNMAFTFIRNYNDVGWLKLKKPENVKVTFRILNVFVRLIQNIISIVDMGKNSSSSVNTKTIEHQERNL